jgi:hypothetical protein
MTKNNWNAEAIASEYLDANIELITNLYMRWCCEREYEAIEDYRAAFARLAKPGKEGKAIVVKATKRPFGFIVEYAGAEWAIAVSRRSATMYVKRLLGDERAAESVN